MVTTTEQLMTQNEDLKQKVELFSQTVSQVQREIMAQTLRTRILESALSQVKLLIDQIRRQPDTHTGDFLDECFSILTTAQDRYYDHSSSERAQ